MARLILFLYQCAFPLIALGVVVRMLLMGRGRILAEGLQELRERAGLPRRVDLVSLEGKVIWLHAASVGEVSAAKTLLERIKARKDPPRIVLTTSTRAGRDQAKRLATVDAALIAPMDFYPAVAAFLKRVRPSALILIETELWPMTILTARRRGVALAIVNGRISERTYSRYCAVHFLMKPVLGSFSAAAIQTSADRARFAALGLGGERAKVTGNIKYDARPATDLLVQECREAVASAGMAGKPLFVAGSTWPEEEELVARAFLHARKARPELCLVVAPRHVERAGETAACMERAGLKTSRLSRLAGACATPGAASTPGVPTGLSQAVAATEPVDCLVLDVLGKLTGFYALCDVAFVGGTLADIGGHNLLEPALAGKPTLFGPYTRSIEAPAKALETAGGRRVTAETFEKELSWLLAHPEELRDTGRRARETALTFSGATDRALACLETLI